MSLRLPAIVLEQRGQPPRLEEVIVHEPGPNEVAVRLVASGICHTDLGAVRDARAVPILLGHEGAGIVETVGAGVTHVQPGDHVVINWQVKCLKCRWCLAGRQDLCENVQATAEPRVYWREQPINLLLNAGTFCPVAVLPAMGAVPIRKDMPLDKAALLGCAVATGVGAALYTARVGPGQTVAVIGTGGVGLNIVQGARLANAGLIAAIDIDPDNLRLAAELGATHTIDSRSADPIQAIKDLTGGRGVEHVFEVVGLPELMAQGIDMLSRGGALTLVGAAARDAQMQFAPRRFMSQQQTIQGCIYGNIRPGIDLSLFADWYMDGRLKLDELHTRNVRLEDVPDLFVNREKLGGIRTVIQFEGAS
ncbi:MAG: Zn-dependent alcohol dehydrogenase [Chloroflexi bacterium]|nr:Zn-dependent alcohol dehydrogenase [Chloroflexota bacterium]